MSYLRDWVFTTVSYPASMLSRALGYALGANQAHDLLFSSFFFPSSRPTSSAMAYPQNLQLYANQLTKNADEVYRNTSKLYLKIVSSSARKICAGWH